MKTCVLLIALLFSCLIAVKSQEIIGSDSLIGSWKYKGPSQIDLNDTIELIKIVSTDNDYYLWTFRPYRNRLERTFNFNSNPKPNSVVATKIDKWFFNNNTKILTLEFYDYKQQFKIIKSNGQIVKLLRIN